MSTPATPQPEPLLISEPEAARLLGVSPKTLYNRRKRGEVPHLVFGGRILYSPEGLRDFIAKEIAKAVTTTGEGAR
ncbi:MAG: helix-turn-helix domain-containing protein [Planctomycetes bacterium]|nr:helix-turn-helix domain-containing protein [Planctomycetota bacterium]